MVAQLINYFFGKDSMSKRDSDATLVVRILLFCSGKEFTQFSQGN